MNKRLGENITEQALFAQYQKRILEMETGRRNPRSGKARRVI
jgi:hypothetical protein